jgi:hypothetical protein
MLGGYILMATSGYLPFTASDLIEVVPVEFEAAHGSHKPRIRRHLKLKFGPFKLKELEEIAQEIHVKEKVSVYEVSDIYYCWRYPRKPLVIFDRLEDKIKTTKSEFSKHGERTCMQTAAIFVKLLTSKKYRLAKSIRTSYTIDIRKIGYNKEDREVTYRAIEMLLKYRKRKIRCS